MRWYLTLGTEVKMKAIDVTGKREIILKGTITRKSLVKNMIDTSYKVVDIGCHDAEMFGDKATNVDMEFHDVPNFIQADAHDLPFEDLEFDFAYCGELLEHVEDPLQVLNEVQRIAQIIVFTVPNEYEWVDALEPFKNEAHKRFFAEDTLGILVARSGLQILEFLKLRHGGWSHFIVRGASKYTKLGEWRDM